MKLQSSRISQAKSNAKRRRRRLKLAKGSMEKALLRSEGGSRVEGEEQWAELPLELRREAYKIVTYLLILACLLAMTLLTQTSQPHYVPSVI